MSTPTSPDTLSLSPLVLPSRSPPSSTSSLFAGAASGLSVDLLFYPLDTLKTRLQSRNGFLASGGFKGVYKGIGSVALGSAPGAAAFFTSYEALKDALSQTSTLGINKNPAIQHMLAASGGEFIACLIRVPVEIVKSRTQINSYGKEVGSWKGAKMVWAREGLKGFYRGFGVTIAREVGVAALSVSLSSHKSN